jgi:predicted Zn-dependent protease
MSKGAHAIVILAPLVALILTGEGARVTAQAPSLDRWVRSDLRPGVIAAPNFPPVATLGPYPTLFPYSALTSGYPQPLGHQIIYTGRNSYVYRPVTNLRGMVATAIEDLRGGRFEEALVELQPVQSENATDGFAALLESQAQFGAGKYSQAAESLRVALMNLPQDHWGQTVVDHEEYFGSSDRYMKRLYALASHVREQPTDAAAHFLLGWHLGFLGHATGATRELQAAIELSSQRDELAQRLLAHFARRAEPRGQNAANAADHTPPPAGGAVPPSGAREF